MPIIKGLEGNVLENLCIQKKLYESSSAQIPIYAENKNRVEKYLVSFKEQKAFREKNFARKYLTKNILFACGKIITKCSKSICSNAQAKLLIFF